eukprot:3537355-Rhodomonas_salina.2
MTLHHDRRCSDAGRGSEASNGGRLARDVRRRVLHDTFTVLEAVRVVYTMVDVCRSALHSPGGRGSEAHPGSIPWPGPGVRGALWWTSVD